MPAAAAITPLGWQLIDALPTWARDAPEFRAVQHCFAKEADYERALARRVRDNMIPVRVDELGLSWWEEMLKLPVNPPDINVEDRRASVLAGIGRMIADATGFHWVGLVTELIGLGWSWSLDGNTITLVVPLLPGSEAFLRLERLVREFTPAHLDIDVSGGAGFILDQSQLDQEPFHPS